MRALFLIALLASAAAPAIASAQDQDRHDDRKSSQSERAERPGRADRPQRAERADRPQRAERADRPERAERADPPQRVEAPDRPQRAERQADRIERVERRNDIREDRAAARAEASARADRRDVDTVRTVRESARRDAPDSVGNWRADERSQTRAERQLERRIVRESQDYARSPATADRREDRVRRVPIEGSQPPPRIETAHRDGDRDGWRDGGRDRRRDGDRNDWRGRDGHRWSGNWRNDHRYDWRHYRDRNRSIFRIGVYFDPFGWNYRRYNVGWRLWPSYYSSRFWINDPWMYRLPYAPPGTRWIRYYDDAVLVDTWDGEIVDVIYNFFW